MKLLDNAKLTEIANKISENAVDCVIDFRLESYSCKMVSTDKKVWKNANGTVDVLSPPDGLHFSNSLGVTNLAAYDTHRLRHFSERSLSGSDNDTPDENLAQIAGTISRKTLFNLTQAMNYSFPDYDFSNKKSSSFALIPSYQSVKDICDRHLSITVDGYLQYNFALWESLEEEIKPSECVIYSYLSSNEVDPFNEDGVLWHFNFLFTNKALKRVLLLSCRAIHNQSSEDGEDDEDWIMD